MPRREYHSSCVCVPPGGPPEGIPDIAEYIVSRVIFVLFLFWGKNFLYGQAPFCTDVSVFAKKKLSVCRFFAQKKEMDDP